MHVNVSERNRLTSGEESEPQEKSWIELTFRKRECSKFIPISSQGHDTTLRCGCGRLRSDHHYLGVPGIPANDDFMPLGANALNFNPKFSVVSETSRDNRNDETSFMKHDTNSTSSPKREEKWNIMQHTTLFPTDAHGTLEFQGTGEGDKSKYIRLSHDTNPDLILELLYDQWKLDPPKMVITVHGGAHNFQLQPKLHRVFCNGLIKAAKTTGAWIMAFGLNTGVGVIVGDALKEHKANSPRKIVSIGVAPWGVVDHREDLIGSEQINSYQTMGNPLSKGSVLHTAHTHFLLVDNGTKGRYDSEIRFRRQLERRLSQQQMLMQHPRHERTSMVCLVLEGGKNTINVVLECVKQSPPIPVIVCDGSGRAADLLSFAHQYVEEDGTLIEELKVQLLALIQETFKCSRDQAQYFYLSIMDCVKKKDLITVFRMNKDSSQDDIDIAILTATLKAQCKSAPEMLSLALSWDRIDIATSQIFVYGRQWPVFSLQQAMLDALIDDRVDFVKLLMENGVSMHKFLTVTTLEDLYNGKTPVHLVYLINDVKKNIPPGYRFTLMDIGQVIELLMGGAYRSSYTRKRFRLYYSSRAKSEPKMRKQLSFKMGLNAFSNTSASSKAESNPISPFPDAKPSDAAAPVAQPHFAYPFHELMVWAVLMKRQKMALFMWQQGEEAIAKALVACKLYKTMAKEAADDDLDVEESAELKAYSKEFQDLAVQLLEICYHSDDDATKHLLTYELKQWSRQTCLSLAVSAKHREFIAHPCVQLLLNDLWMGGLNERKNSALKVIMGIVFFFTIPSLDFKTQEELQLMPQTMEEHMQDVSSLSSSIAGSSSDSSSQSSSSSSSSGRTSTSLPKPEVLGKPIAENKQHDPYMILSLRPKQLETRKKFYEFYNAPITKFWVYALAYTCMVLLYTYVVLVKMGPLPSIAEWLVISHAVTIAIEKIREIAVSEPSSVMQKLKVWSGSFWNFMDVVTIVTFFIGVGLRFSSDKSMMLSGRAIYCVNIVLWYTHLLNVFSVNKHLGPLITLMGKMLVDMIIFIILLFVVLASFGVARQALLHPHEEPSWLLLKTSLLEPYFMLYGEVYAGTIDPCFGSDKALCVIGSWMSPILMTVYLLICNILLLNLLIAVFNNTFARVKNYSDRIWKFQRYRTIVEYELRPVLPPPLMLFSYVSMIIQSICKKRKNATDRGLKLFLDDDDVEKLHDFEEDCVDEYVRRNNKEKHQNEEKRNEERLQKLLDSVEETSQNQTLMINHMASLLERLENMENVITRHEPSSGEGSRRSRHYTGGHSESWSFGPENDPHSFGYPEALPSLKTWAFRHHKRTRQDSEMSTTSDWHQINFRARHLSQDRNKLSTTQDKAVDTDSRLRRTNSAGILWQISSDSATQPDNTSNVKVFHSNNQITVEDQDSKSLSCQDIMMIGSNRLKRLPAVDCEIDGPCEKATSPTDESPTQDCSVHCVTEETGVFVSTDSDATSDGDPSGMFIGVSDNGFHQIPDDVGDSSKKPQPVFRTSETTTCTTKTSPASSVQDHINRRLSYSSSRPIPKNKSFDQSMSKYLTPNMKKSSPGAKQTYKSITDQIDTSRWHEMYASPVPYTPMDGWWCAKGPDFDSYHRPVKFGDQTSLMEWEEDNEVSIKKKERSKTKHRKRMKRNKKTLTKLPELPSTPQLNINNNSSEGAVVEQSSTFPRMRRSLSQTSKLSKSQTLFDAEATILM